MYKPIFSSFFQGGFECSTHRLRDGRKLDLVESTGHAKFVKQDYARLREQGISTVREGLRWHVIERAPGVYDFSTVTPFLEAAKECGIEIIWDILHFGWPDRLDIYTPEWLAAFERFAEEFALFLKTTDAHSLWVAPVNEISFFAWGGGDVGCLNPFSHGRGGELKKQLVRASIAAIKSVRFHVPQAQIMSPEPIIHISGNPLVEGDREWAAFYRSFMYEAWDMILGRAYPELGGDPQNLDMLGINFYPRNQRFNDGRPLNPNDPGYMPFHQLLIEVYERYHLPMFISETGTENEERRAWLAYIAEEVRRASASGVPIHGICLYPILNHPGWDDDRHCHNGLWDYPSGTGEREIYKPLAQEITRQQKFFEEV